MNLGGKARRGTGSVMTRANVEGNYLANLRVRAEHQNRVEDFTILIVEDHVVIAADLADAVQRSGGQVLGPVSRLSEALAVITTTPCDAALLDINLGHETSYLAAQMLQVREVPFAFLTGSEGDEIESRYAKVPVLRKPFSEMEIESCLRRLMGSSGMPAPLDCKDCNPQVESR